MNTEMLEWTTGLRQPRAPKPHVMRKGGWWFIVDRSRLATWQQLDFPTHGDPRPWLQA